jgi:hypothetical protein
LIDKIIPTTELPSNEEVISLTTPVEATATPVSEDIAPVKVSLSEHFNP